MVEVSEVERLDIFLTSEEVSLSWMDRTRDRFRETYITYSVNTRSVVQDHAEA